MTILKQDQIKNFWQLPKDCYVESKPTPLADTKLLKYNSNLAASCQWPTASDSEWLDILSLAKSHPSYPPIATPYAGHQYTELLPLLGDGRSHLLAQLKGYNNTNYEIQAKGSGRTVYAGNGNGRLSLESAVKEYENSEKMANLGIATTRSLAIFKSSEVAKRKSIYPAALLIRTAPSFIRFGHFEYFYYQQQPKLIKVLADFVISNYFPDLWQLQHEQRYAKWFERIMRLNATMVAGWMCHGFCHGTINTDNMSIFGLTIDYGTCGWMADFNFDFNSNISDYTQRYAYYNQPMIVKWNLMQLSITLS
ncbi:MAG: protein adenylyltransferase SelO family protein, partial [Pseudomonadota bacterium]